MPCVGNPDGPPYVMPVVALTVVPLNTNDPRFAGDDVIGCSAATISKVSPAVGVSEFSNAYNVKFWAVLIVDDDELSYVAGEASSCSDGIASALIPAINALPSTSTQKVFFIFIGSRN